jgi:hypothetical protein
MNGAGGGARGGSGLDIGGFITISPGIDEGGGGGVGVVVVDADKEDGGRGPGGGGPGGGNVLVDVLIG